MTFNPYYGYRALPPGPRTVLFLSQKFEAEPDTNPFDGYNEKRVLDHVIYCSESIGSDNNCFWTVLVQPAEGQDHNEFNYLTWWSGKTKIEVIKDGAKVPLDYPDLIVGMTSPILIDAVMATRPVMSIMPRLKSSAPWCYPLSSALFQVFRIIDLTDAIKEVMYTTRARARMHERCLMYQSKQEKEIFFESDE